jgi:hypothetical protein
LSRTLACGFCLPSFNLLAPILTITGEAGVGWAVVAVLTSVWVGPMFTLMAVTLAVIAHFTSAIKVGERRLWTLVVLATTANLLLSAGGLAIRLLRPE